jgi:hypothetical protein
MSADQFTRLAIARKTGEPPAANRATVGKTQLGHRIRELKVNLVRDVLHAISMASPDELGDLFPAALERANPVSTASTRAAQLPSEARERGAHERRPSAATKTRDTWVPLAENGANERDASSPPPPNDPFDITSPMELLASTDDPPLRPAAVHEPPARMPSILEHPRPAESVTSLVDGDKEAASERRPTVVLREGEHLLSATGSGVVIRRERRVSPPR